MTMIIFVSGWKSTCNRGMLPNLECKKKRHKTTLLQYCMYFCVYLKTQLSVHVFDVSISLHLYFFTHAMIHRAFIINTLRLLPKLWCCVLSCVSYSVSSFTADLLLKGKPS